MVDVRSPGEPRGMTRPRNPDITELSRRVGAEVRGLRSRAGLTQEQLAARAGVKPETVSRVENGVRLPDLVTLGHLARALGVTLGRVVDAVPDDASVDTIARLATELSDDDRDAVVRILRTMTHR